VLHNLKKILQINTVINTGSTGRIAEDIGIAILKSGWESYIAYGRYGNSSKSRAIKIGNRIDNYIQVLYTRLLDKHGYGSKRATRSLIREIKKINPDIIHLHNVHGYYLNLNIFFRYLHSVSIPVVWTLHDCWAYTGHCTHYMYVDCQKWMDHCNCCPQIGQYPKSFIDNSYTNFKRKKQLFNDVKNLTVVPVSNWLEGQLKHSFLKGVPLKKIYNGINTAVYKTESSLSNSRRYGLKDKFVILGVASKWEDRKGLIDFKLLSENLLDDELIVLIGLTEMQIKSLPPKILGIKRTEDIKQLIEFYSTADVLFSPSKEETFGLVVIEAMACGTPAIVYNSTASPELVDEQTGFVVDIGNLLEIRLALNKVKEKGKEHYADFCRERVVRYFERNTMCNAYLDLYKNILHLHDT